MFGNCVAIIYIYICIYIHIYRNKVRSARQTAAQLTFELMEARTKYEWPPYTSGRIQLYHSGIEHFNILGSA